MLVVYVLDRHVVPYEFIIDEKDDEEKNVTTMRMRRKHASD